MATQQMRSQAKPLEKFSQEVIDIVSRHQPTRDEVNAAVEKATRGDIEKHRREVVLSIG